MTYFARTERLALCDLLDEVGPDAPTLCEGWTTYDLAAHLVTRERRPDSGPGIMIKRFAGYTDRVREKAKQRPYTELTATLRQGPPMPLRVERVDAAMNTTEMFVHHEDVRRARADWEPRELDQASQDTLWRTVVRGARLMARQSPVGLSLTRTGPDRVYDTVVAKRAVPDVTVIGDVGELTLFLSGRSGVARVEFSGDDDAVKRLTATKFGL